jgi:hypothetical protein
MKFEDERRRKNIKVVNVCLKCGKEWEEVLPFEYVPMGKLFGVCNECKGRSD